jgi:hypothetical protein
MLLGIFVAVTLGQSFDLSQNLRGNYVSESKNLTGLLKRGDDHSLRQK